MDRNGVAKASTSVPFLIVGLGWAVFGVLLCLRLAPEAQSFFALKWMLGLAVVCMMDLMVLAQAVASTIDLMSSDRPEFRPNHVVRLLFWGFAKVACLGIIGVVIWNGRSIPLCALFTGLATLVVVPLVGGLWWSYQDE